MNVKEIIDEVLSNEIIIIGGLHTKLRSELLKVCFDFHEVIDAKNVVFYGHKEYPSLSLTSTGQETLIKDEIKSIYCYSEHIPYGYTVIFNQEFESPVYSLNDFNFHRFINRNNTLISNVFWCVDDKVGTNDIILLKQYYQIKGSIPVTLISNKQQPNSLLYHQLIFSQKGDFIFTLLLDVTLKDRLLSKSKVCEYRRTQKDHIANMVAFIRKEYPKWMISEKSTLWDLNKILRSMSKLSATSDFSYDSNAKNVMLSIIKKKYKNQKHIDAFDFLKFYVENI